MKTVVTGLTGVYHVQHLPHVEASVVVKLLEEAGKIPFRSWTTGGGVALQIGGAVLEIGGEMMDIVIFSDRIGVIPRPKDLA